MRHSVSTSAPLSHSPPDMTPHLGIRADRVTRLLCSCQSCVWLESCSLLTNVLAGCWGTFMCDCDDMIFAPRSGSSPSQQPAVVILFDGEALQPAPAAAAAAAEERGKVCQEIVPSFLSAWAQHSSSSTPRLFAVSLAQPAQPAQPRYD